MLKVVRALGLRFQTIAPGSGRTTQLEGVAALDQVTESRNIEFEESMDDGLHTLTQEALEARVSNDQQREPRRRQIRSTGQQSCKRPRRCDRSQTQCAILRTDIATPLRRVRRRQVNLLHPPMLGLLMPPLPRAHSSLYLPVIMPSPFIVCFLGSLNYPIHRGYVREVYLSHAPRAY